MIDVVINKLLEFFNNKNLVRNFEIFLIFSFLLFFVFWIIFSPIVKNFKLKEIDIFNLLEVKRAKIFLIKKGDKKSRYSEKILKWIDSESYFNYNNKNIKKLKDPFPTR
ncbi:MAG: hypothetical protein AM1032_000057 [Mycoplasmataceae bacterium]|nr:MAG: hypothetical protein AM1032_000057 [Mycoplasmataceae bacterium]